MTQQKFDINAVVEKVEIAGALPEGRHVGIISKIEEKTISFADEDKERLMWTFSTEAGTAVGFTGFAATANSNLFKVCVNLGAMGKPLSSLIGKKVGFTVMVGKSGKASVELASVVPA